MTHSAPSGKTSTASAPVYLPPPSSRPIDTRCEAPATWLTCTGPPSHLWRWRFPWLRLPPLMPPTLNWFAQGRLWRLTHLRRGRSIFLTQGRLCGPLMAAPNNLSRNSPGASFPSLVYCICDLICAHSPVKYGPTASVMSFSTLLRRGSLVRQTGSPIFCFFGVPCSDTLLKSAKSRLIYGITMEMMELESLFEFLRESTLVGWHLPPTGDWPVFLTI